MPALKYKDPDTGTWKLVPGGVIVAGGGGGSGDSEPPIAAGNGTQYWRGDKTWQTLNWAAISAKPTTFTPTIGATSTTAVAGDDVRLTDARVPLAHTQTASTISDSTAVGRSVLTAADAAAARAAIGAGTSNLALGTTSTTAKAGDYVPDWSAVTSKPTTFAPVIGTTSTTAKAGDYQPTWAQVTSKPTTFPPVIGATAADAVAGNDARLTNSRTPTAHTHPASELTATGTRDATTYLRGDNTWQPVSVGAADWSSLTGKPTTFPPIIGAGAADAVAGNDPRLSEEVKVSHQPAPSASNLELWVDLDESPPTNLSWIRTTQAQYDALGTPNPDVLYVVIG